VTAAAGAPKASDLWRTPCELFLALHAEFGFQVDLAANAQDRLLDRWLGPGGLGEDALSATAWMEYGRRGPLNPPYSSALIKAFLAKAALEAECGFTSVCPDAVHAGYAVVAAHGAGGRDPRDPAPREIPQG